MIKNLISVIIPVYNVEKFLEKTIDSVLKQTYNNLEIILINGGSTDNSLKICRKFEKIDNRSGEEIAKNYINEISKNLPTKIENLTEITNAISINSKMYFRKTYIDCR